MELFNRLRSNLPLTFWCAWNALKWQQNFMLVLDPSHAIVFLAPRRNRPRSIFSLCSHSMETSWAGQSVHTDGEDRIFYYYFTQPLTGLYITPDIKYFGKKNPFTTQKKYFTALPHALPTGFEQKAYLLLYKALSFISFITLSTF